MIPRRPQALIIWSDNASSEEVNVRGLLLITVASILWLPASVAQQKAARSARSADTRYAAQRQFVYPKEFKPGKPYSPGVKAGDTLYIAGQVDKDPQIGAQPSGIAAQTRLAMDNVGHVLRAAGMDY